MNHSGLKKLVFIALFVLAGVAGARTYHMLVVQKTKMIEREKKLSKKPNSYSKEWQKVEALEAKGLYRSALDVVEEIYKKAKEENNSAQVVKSILYRMKFSKEIDENSTEKSIVDLKNELKKAEYPLKPLLHSILAQTYWNYYQTKRWQFNERTPTTTISDDPATWDVKTIFIKAHQQYQLSLQNAEKLKQTPVDMFDAVLIEQKDTRKFRPTLYDFLAYRAIDFYQNDEVDIIKPAYKFELKDTAYFQTYSAFAKQKIETKDTLSSAFYALKLIQDLIKFHIQDVSAGKPEVLVNIDLHRLKFVRQKSVLDIKDSLYLKTLQQLEEQFINEPVSAEVSYEIATVYEEKGNLYNAPETEEGKWMKKQAVDLCEQVIKKYPQSTAAQNCNSLREEIKAHDLQLKMDHVISPDKPALALLSYKNVKKAYLRIIPFAKPASKEDEPSLYGEELLNYYLKQPTIKEWSLDLPDDGDFQMHATEIRIPEMGVGSYVILISANKDFIIKNNGVAFTPFDVSGISYVIQQMNNGSYNCLVRHRETGASLSNVKAQLFYEKYDYKTRKREFITSDLYTSDVNGYFHIPPTDVYRQSRIEFSYAKSTSPKNTNDFLRVDNAIYQYAADTSKQKAVHKTYLFLDRGIYRPGQTVYFKGVMIRSLDKKNEILPKTKTTVNLSDVNGQTVSALELVTNEYGTFSGSFVIPAGVLTGTMYISNENGTVYFSVEEYKRPKFEVSFQPIKESYRLNDQVQISGSAKTFSGAYVSQAEVKYRVVRKTTYRPYYYFRSYVPRSPEMEIANGILTTSDTGRFSIIFNAIADAGISKTQTQSYSYIIYADVTDINGETHSSQRELIISYSALNLEIDVPDKVDKSKDVDFPVHITNMSGETIPTACKVEIYKLKQPDKTYRSRNWQHPDKYILSKEEFEKDFPTDEYKNENDKSTWVRQQKVLDQSLESFRQTVKTVNLKSWASGVYVLEAHCKDKYGEDVKFLKNFTLYAAGDKKIPVNEVNWFVENTKKAVEPGEKAKFIIGTSENNVNVFYSIEQEGVIFKKELLVLNKEQKTIEVPVEEKYRGNISIQYVFVKNNRSYIGSSLVLVPYTDKELDIQFETFRDKLNPGQQEEWKLKLKDKKGEKVLAEVMATLYDASLDQFNPNEWLFDIYKTYSMNLNWDGNQSFAGAASQLIENEWNNNLPLYERVYDQLNYGYYGSGRNWAGGRSLKMFASKKLSPVMRTNGVAIKDEYEESATGDVIQEEKMPSTKKSETKQEGGNLAAVTTRKNFAETAFFYPQLQTDNEGSISIRFTIPEATTRWKMMGLAHTKDLKTGSIIKQLITQKELMVTPNVPRFFREGDKLGLTTKITNLTDGEMNGEARLFLYDALTMKEIPDSVFSSEPNSKTFIVSKGQNTVVGWNISIPENIEAITYKVVAKAGNFSDGEEMTVPVLSNRMLVTESFPFYVKGNEAKNLRFEKLANQNNGSATLRNHKLTVELTANPAWYAVQALPYLMEYPYACSEQIFSRFYANSIATHIANSSPKIKAVFDAWRNTTGDKSALLSNLEKNQELKSLLLEETPWVMEAKEESERKKRIGLLFDLNKMSNERTLAIRQLKKKQSVNGGWPWFEGMPEDRYITQYIITGLGHLKQLQLKNVQEDNDVTEMVNNAINYLDNQIRTDYEYLKKQKVKMEENHLGAFQIQYLYMRSYFKDIQVSDENKTAFNYYLGQAEKFWLSNDRYLQGMIALTLNRYDKKEIALAILKSLKETSINSEEMGMYWKENYGHYHWHQAPVESQALMIEAFDEVGNDSKSVEALKVWLLRSKQTQNWKTTKATAEAIYALLLKGNDWLSTENTVELKVGGTTVSVNQNDELTKMEAGTGYFKTSWTGNQVQPAMADVSITKNDAGVSWGSMYWQYFEQLDKITPAKTPLQLKKNLFIQKATDAGFVLQPLGSDLKLKVGDKVIVRIELHADRDMEYVHMKDMRASGFEPVNVLSSYKYKDGVGYYESTRDAATNFFFGFVPKGTYVFEYPLMITHEGDFSNGITSVQCMYAPEFTSNSEGVRVKVE